MGNPSTQEWTLLVGMIMGASGAALVARDAVEDYTGPDAEPVVRYLDEARNALATAAEYARSARAKEGMRAKAAGK